MTDAIDVTPGKCSTAAEAEEIVRRFDTAVIGGDLDRAMTWAHPDVTVREAPSLPYANVYTGREGLAQMNEDVAGWWEFKEPLSLQFIGVTPNLVIARIEGPVKVRATGEDVDFLVTEWMTVRDGLLADVEVFYFDQRPLMDAARVVAGE